MAEPSARAAEMVQEQEQRDADPERDADVADGGEGFWVHGATFGEEKEENHEWTRMNTNFGLVAAPPNLILSVTDSCLFVFIRGSILLKHNAFPLKLGAAEVEDKANSKAGETQVVHDLPHFMLADAIDDFGVDDDLSVRDEVGDVLADLHTLVEDWVAWLLNVLDLLESQLDGQGILIRLFK
jgi:hypothetical protein